MRTTTVLVCMALSRFVQSLLVLVTLNGFRVVGSDDGEAASGRGNDSKSSSSGAYYKDAARLFMFLPSLNRQPRARVQ